MRIIYSLSMARIIHQARASSLSATCQHSISVGVSLSVELVGNFLTEDAESGLVGLCVPKRQS